MKIKPEFGCQDGYCDVRGRNTGQHTNGGCHCLIDIRPRTLMREIRGAFRWFHKRVEDLEKEVEEWKGMYGRLSTQYTECLDRSLEKNSKITTLEKKVFEQDKELQSLRVKVLSLGPW